MGNNFGVQIPSSQLVVPVRNRSSNGQIQVDYSSVHTGITATRLVDAALGKAFLSSVYIATDYEKRQFTIWPIGDTTKQDIVTSNGTRAQVQLCPPKAATDGTTTFVGSDSGSSSSTSSSKRLSASAIAGIVIGVLAGLALLAAAILFFLRRRHQARRRDPRALPLEDSDRSSMLLAHRNTEYRRKTEPAEIDGVPSARKEMPVDGEVKRAELVGAEGRGAAEKVELGGEGKVEMAGEGRRDMKGDGMVGGVGDGRRVEMPSEGRAIDVAELPAGRY